MNIKKALLMLGASLVLVVGLIFLSQAITKAEGSRYTIHQPTQSFPQTLPPSQEDTETPPTPASDQFYDTNGKAYTLSDFKDRPLVISLWSVNKSKSTQNLKYLEDIYQEYGNQIHLVVIHVSNESATKERSEERAREEGCTFPIYHDPDGAFLNQYEKNKVPLTIFFREDQEAIAYSDESLNKKILQNGIKAILPQA